MNSKYKKMSKDNLLVAKDCLRAEIKKVNIEADVKILGRAEAERKREKLLSDLADVEGLLQEAIC